MLGGLVFNLNISAGSLSDRSDSTAEAWFPFVYEICFGILWMKIFLILRVLGLSLDQQILTTKKKRKKKSLGVSHMLVLPKKLEYSVGPILKVILKPNGF